VLKLFDARDLYTNSSARAKTMTPAPNSITNNNNNNNNNNNILNIENQSPQICAALTLLRYLHTCIINRSCTMSKRRDNKRIVSETCLSGPSIDLTNKTPNDVALALLACLPDDATCKHKQAKTLLKAFDLTKAELQHRMNTKSRKCQQTGSQQPLLFCNEQVSLPADAFLHILEFLSKTDLVLRTSSVSKAWLAMSRSPQMWTVLDTEHGLLSQSKRITNMDHLLALLERPQFASLKTLVPPDKVRLRKKALEKISESCPLLEDIDIGYSLWSSMHADDNALMVIPSLFPHLRKIRFDLEKVTRKWLFSFLATMADRLVDLRIHTAAGWVLSDDEFQDISRHCQNLEHFSYQQCDRLGGPLSKEGVIALIRGCPKLKSVVLVNIGSVQIEAFEYIAEHATNLQNLLVVVDSRTYFPLMHNSDLCLRLGEKIEHFEAISLRQYFARIDEARRGRRNWY
jgi:hypothetical protein